MDVQTAHEVIASLALTSLTGHVTSLHGDEYEVTDAAILRDSTGYPVAVSVTVHDDTHHEPIRAFLPVQVDTIGA